MSSSSPRRARNCGIVLDVSKELWRPYPGDPRYSVSNLGRVRGISGGVLRPGPSNRYLHVSIGGRSIKVHVLVLETWSGPRPSADLVARHLNGDNLDNRAANLEWGTWSENAEDRRLHGTMPLGSAHYASKLTAAERAEMRRLWVAGIYSIRELARRFGLTYDGAYSDLVKHRHTWDKTR